MPMRDSPKPIVDTIRMSDRDLLRLLAAVDAQHAGGHGGAGHAGILKAPVNLPRVLVQVTDAGTHASHIFLVKLRNIHEHGLVFIHGAFIYENSRCNVLLRSTDSKPVQLHATVVRCNYIAGRLYEVAAAFKQPISLQSYCFADGAPLVAALRADDEHAST